MLNDGTAVLAEIDFLLGRMQACGWKFHYFDGTVAELAVTRRWSDHITDVAIIRGDSTAIAYRTVGDRFGDPLRPDVVVMVYRECPRRVLRASLTFDPPGARLPTLMNAPADCGVSRREPHTQGRNSPDELEDDGTERAVA